MCNDSYEVLTAILDSDAELKEKASDILQAMLKGLIAPDIGNDAISLIRDCLRLSTIEAIERLEALEVEFNTIGS